MFKQLDAYWEAKKVEFKDAPNMESFARGVEEGLLKALIILRNQPKT